MKRACLDCGKPFQPRHARHRRCDAHQVPFDAAAAHYRSPGWNAARPSPDAYCVVPGCGSRVRLTRHHVEPLRRGGSDEHVVLLCGSHHASYEAAALHDKNTELRRFVDSLGAR